MKSEHTVLYIGIGLVLLAMLLIPIMDNPQSTHATDVSNDQPPIFMTLGGNTSSGLNTNEPCTYLIFRDVPNNQTLSKNCSTGNIDFKNADSYTVIEQTINSKAINQVSGASKVQGGLIFIKSGLYSISKTINLNVSSVTLQGENEQNTPIGGERHYATVLKMANGTNLAQIVLVNAQAGGILYGDSIRDMTIDGNAPSASGTSTEGIREQSVADQQIENTQIVFTKNIALRIQNGIAGFYKDVHAESGNAGIYLFGNVAGGGTIGNRFVGNYIDNANNSTSITIEGYVQGNTFLGNIIREDKGRCFYMFADSSTNFPARNTFTGNECMFITTSGNGLYGFDLSGSQNNLFTGNLIFNWGQSASNTYDGFFLHTNNVNSVNNTFTGNEIVSNSVTNHMRYGFNENDANQDFNVYVGNNIAGMATAPIKTLGVHSHASINLGYNPVASSSVTAGASVWTYTNNDGYTEQMFTSAVNGETAETCNGIAIGTPGTCLLDVGQSLTSTWATTAPVFKKVPMD